MNRPSSVQPSLDVEITPKVHENNEVSLHLDLDVSQVKDYVTIGGISEPEISQNKATADIRLREGEVNLIGGILQDTETKSLSGYPWLSKLPVLKYLFGQEAKQRQQSEIVFGQARHGSIFTSDDHVHLYQLGCGAKRRRGRVLLCRRRRGK